MIKRLLSHPLTRGMDLDAPETIALRRRIIQQKPFLKQIYEEWYLSIASALPLTTCGPILELGTGAGYLKHYIPSLITSEVFHVEDVDVIINGLNLPFQNASLNAIVMTNVFHHLHDPRSFFKEAARCVRPHGVVIMIEPWVTPWSRWVYSLFHNEPFRPESIYWEITGHGPLTSANGALPWIIFHRDRKQFETEFPEWMILGITPTMPFRYLISGGVSMRNLMPGWSFKFWHRLETAFTPWMNNLAMFAQIVIQLRN